MKFLDLEINFDSFKKYPYEDLLIFQITVDFDALISWWTQFWFKSKQSMSVFGGVPINYDSFLRFWFSAKISKPKASHHNSKNKLIREEL